MAPRGYTWRYVAHDLIGSLKLEKIIHKDPLDSDIERGPRMQELIDKVSRSQNRQKQR